MLTNAGALERFFGAGGTFRHTRTHSGSGGLKLNPTATVALAPDTKERTPESARSNSLRASQYDIGFMPAHP